MQIHWPARLYQLLFLLLPWSVEADFGVWNLTVPAEPLIALAGIGLAVELFRGRRLPELSLLAWITAGWVAWLAIAALSSSMAVVSWKYWLVEAGHWWVFFAGLYCFPEWRPRLMRLFSWSMLGVVVYVIGHHAFYHFRADQAMLAPMPFFSDHTVYSAVLVMLLFYSTANLRNQRGCTLFKFQIKLFKFDLNESLWGRKLSLKSKVQFEKFNLKSFTAPRFLKLMAMGLALLALILAASRAAWLSLALAALAGFLFYFKKYHRQGLLFTGLALCAGIFFQEKIQTQFAADVSWQERLNRYACAARMVAERPWTGFGPGTFQFQYFPYQKQEEMTRISRTVPIRERGPDNYGRGGGAHSEYMQALAETGYPGLALWLILVCFSLYAGIQRYRETGALFWLLLSLGLFSFFLHGLINNFLHDARVAALVWGMIAAIARGR